MLEVSVRGPVDERSGSAVDPAASMDWWQTQVLRALRSSQPERGGRSVSPDVVPTTENLGWKCYAG